MQMSPQFVYPVAATLSAIVGSVFDVKSRRIPNFITAPSMLLGLMLHFSLGGWRPMLSAGLAGIACGLVFLVFYLAGGMGAGDVKMITAVGCLAGLSNAGSELVLTALTGGVMALFLALTRGRLKETVLNLGTIANHHRQQGLTPHPEINVRNGSTLRLPYGLAIAAGSLLTVYFQAVQN